MKTMLLLTLFILTSCGSDIFSDNVFIQIEDPLDPRKKSGIDPEFSDEINLFERINCRQVQIPVNFGPVGKSPRVGVCNTYKYGNILYREIYIDRDFWYSASDNQRESLILHELGHCVLRRDHIESIVERDGTKIIKSIMNPSIIGGKHYYEANKQYYYNELVGRIHGR